MPTSHLAVSPLVSTEWLAAHLDDPKLRIIDASAHFSVSPAGAIEVSSGRLDYSRAHIPGAVFVDLLVELSDPTSDLKHMLPDEAQFATQMGEFGVGDDDTVVIYSATRTAWATRLWWMLKAFSFERVAVLDGGLRKWQREGRPTTSSVTPIVPRKFTAKFRRESVADKTRVLGAVTSDSSQVCLIDALEPASFAGTAPSPFGRAGHIPRAVNVPTSGLIDPQTGVFLSAAELQRKLPAHADRNETEIITYCGSGMSATVVAFALALLGKDNVAVYDASLQEWARDPSLPMERTT